MRFNKPAYATVHFSEKIWVKCPNCSDLGLVTTELGSYNIPYPRGYNTSFNCKCCGLRKEDNTEWLGFCQGTLNQACGYCGSYIYYVTEPTMEPYKTTIFECEICRREKEYELKWYRFRQDRPTDPFFGFDLWMQTSVKSNVLWVYNLDHLVYLRQYVSAKMRDDDGRTKYSMIAKLPQWIKSANNRDLIVRKLNKLEVDLLGKIDSY